MRDDVEDRVDKVREDISDRVDTAKEDLRLRKAQAEEAVKVGRSTAGKAREDLEKRVAESKEEYRQRVAELTDKAEEEIAESFDKASEHYKHNQAALHLRAMNMVYEGLRQKGSMIIVPSSAVETMGLGAMGGLTAFDRILGQGSEKVEEKDNSSSEDKAQ